jgi:hypothetical protein
LRASDSFSKSSMREAATMLVSGNRKGMLVAALCFDHCVAGPILGTEAQLSV